MAGNIKKTAFKPSVHGFHFKNGWPIEVLMKYLDSSAFAEIVKIAVESMGLCGGMCWAALDRYFNGEPIPFNQTPPSADDPLFRELFNRQIDSFRFSPLGGFSTINQCIDWQSRPDEGHWHDRSSVGHLTQTEQWPSVRQKLDDGIPATLCLIRTEGIAKPWGNHQVVATGYNFDDISKRLTIYIYDPNHPDNNNVSISMTFGQENSRLDASQSTEEKLRGFFFIPYDRAERVIQIQPGTSLRGKDDLSWFPILWDSVD